jgi:hypothetical protein
VLVDENATQLADTMHFFNDCNFVRNLLARIVGGSHSRVQDTQRSLDVYPNYNRHRVWVSAMWEI